MKPFLLSATLLLLAACTAQVSHPTKSLAQQQADIDLCTKSATGKYWMDPVAALYNAYDCLEAKGYQRSRKDFAARVERALGERPATPRQRAEPGKPCRIPCT
jgi:hypothetical protein